MPLTSVPSLKNVKGSVSYWHRRTSRPVKMGEESISWPCTSDILVRGDITFAPSAAVNLDTFSTHV